MIKQVESNVGIKSYISDHSGFSAIIKQRYSDFLVNELGNDGEIIHLTSEKVVPVPTEAKPKTNCEIQPPEITDEEVELMKLLSGQILREHMKPSTFIIKTGSDYIKRDFDEKNFKSVKINVDDVSKERRTVIHMYIKSKFPNLNSTTTECESSKFIVVKKKGLDEAKKSRKPLWPASQRYLTFVLYKENIDTIDAVNFIQAKLKLRQNSLSYAGVKDKRGKTAQLVSVYQVAPQNISAAVRNMYKLRVGNFTFRSKPLKLGDLGGNYFQIVLREAKVEDDVLEVAMKSLKENGFINYYGMQRFGSLNLTTHLIGKTVLQGHFKEAIDMLLLPKENDPEDMLKAKEIWTSKRDALQAFKCLEKGKNTIEKQVFSALAQFGASNYVTAFEKLPRNVSLMYVHAYQSYIWNCIVSKRIDKYSLKVLPGDLVLNETRIRKKLLNHKESTKEWLDDDNFLDSCEDLDDEEEKNKLIHIISEEETEIFDISEVVLPCPGIKNLYPNNEIRGWYEELLGKDDISFSNLNHKVKTFHVGGSYRKIVVRPGNLNYFTCCYNDSTLPLIQSDLDAISNIDVSPNRLESGKHKAVIVNLSLPRSSYATMALRELMKIETSSQFQESLNSTTSTVSTSNCSDECQVENKNDGEIDETGRTEDSNKRPNTDFDDNLNEKKIKTSN